MINKYFWIAFTHVGEQEECLEIIGKLWDSEEEALDHQPTNKGSVDPILCKTIWES